MGMLILTLRENDVVHLQGEGLSNEIRVMCTRVGENRVRIGFDAPDDIKVSRDKVLNKINAEHRTR